MSYTKIAHKNEPWNDSIIKDIDKSQKPLFVLVDRFNVYKLKVLNQREFGKRKDIFLIQGLKQKNERCIVTLEIDQSYNMVVSVKMRFARTFDCEMSNLLKMALLVRLKNADTYYFSARILPDLKPS